MRVETHAGRPRVLVLDRGPGLKAGDFPHLFEEFARLSARPTAGETSHGLGLAERAGHRVRAVERGAEAVRAVQEGGYDLVLMDVEMEGMSGLEAARRIRDAGPAAERLPIIGLTGHADPARESACLDAGMNEVIVKPLRAGVLEGLVGRWVR